jgi:hypothetical protein
MNEKDAQSISDMLIEIYVFVKAHYYYYTGVLIGMLDNSEKFKTWLEFIRYNVICVIVVKVTLIILIENKAPLWATIVFCNVVGLYFHPTFKHFSLETLPRIYQLITDSALKIGKALTDRIIDIINKK